MKTLYPIKKLLSNSSNFWIVFSVGLIVILTSSLSFSQPVMTSKEGFYFTLKANNFNMLDNAIDGPQLKVRWFDLYLEFFDKTNYEKNRNDEFKWPQYSKNIVAEINNGITSSDFSKLFSYTCAATLGKWDSENSNFPITELWNEIVIAEYPLAYNDFSIRHNPTLNNQDFDFKLRMDPLKAENFIASRKDNNGNVDRKITAKVIYNVVNKNMDQLRKPTKVYMGIYMHKIIFMNGATVLGEIKPKVDYYDKVNLVKFKREETPTISDIDGNVYHTIKIGTQVWMAENFRTTKFNDGTLIPNVTNNTEWANLKTPGYCWYGNDIGRKGIHGALYNWHAVNNGKLAPKGWHVPTDAEWTTLINYLGGETVAGGTMKVTGTSLWQSPNTGATNESGFTAIPGGGRDYEGTCNYISKYSTFWSSTEYDLVSAYYLGLNCTNGNSKRNSVVKCFGYSVRCIKD